ncbi:MAG: L-glutamate gamma-semialdehyde dehydrogenase [Xanthomonadales bacterium]|nr:L-glutamate gamma-semialdehyde dehydrogenase [Xanthomonadales bacterium]
MNADIQIPTPVNEPIKSYAPGTPERASLMSTMDTMAAERIEIPAVIGGHRVTTGRTDTLVMPHKHEHVLADYHKCREAEVNRAIQAAGEAWESWASMAWQDRAAIFLKAADLLSGPWRDTLNAATMLGQSKTAYQAEIDSACELIDFWRFNCSFLNGLYAEQPRSAPGMWNYVDYRPLEGFVLAVTPFNFTAIGGNLPTAPALMGNTVLWKPSHAQVYSAWFTLQILEEAGLPPGVINLLPGDGPDIGGACLASEHLAGIHFTGSTATFQHLWREVGQNIDRYRSYPRVVGETGGKDFVFAHESADAEALITALVRGAFEYQGQKCSAASRAFIPASLWEAVVNGLKTQLGTIQMGNPRDFSNFIGAVIDRRSFDKIKGYIEFAQGSDDHEVIVGGGCDDSEGYFIEPTVVVASGPDTRLMCEEIFGPVLTLYRYENADIDDAIKACDEASPYALTGAVFARDRRVVAALSERLRFAAGNFYINDKPTGAVVGQQPFGGGRASGTNDKAGSVLNLLRWVSPRAIKETFDPPKDYRYPHMAE